MARLRYQGLEGRNLVTQTLPEAFTRDYQPLPYDHALYFAANDLALLIPAEALVASRARPKGLANAAILMRQAASGAVARRVPLTVRPLEDGRYLVIDGNSTFLNGWLSGWPDLPCLIEHPTPDVHGA